MTVALDSNVFIAFIEQSQNTRFFRAAAAIMLDIEAGKLSPVYSSLVFGEVMRLPAGSSLAPVQRFFESVGGQDYPADRLICSRAAELRRLYPALKLPDAIHLATALIAGAATFVTADKSLLNIAQQEIRSTFLAEYKAYA